MTCDVVLMCVWCVFHPWHVYAISGDLLVLSGGAGGIARRQASLVICGINSRATAEAPALAPALIWSVLAFSGPCIHYLACLHNICTISEKFPALPIAGILAQCGLRHNGGRRPARETQKILRSNIFCVSLNIIKHDFRFSNSIFPNSITISRRGGQNNTETTTTRFFTPYAE